MKHNHIFPVLFLCSSGIAVAQQTANTEKPTLKQAFATLIVPSNAKTILAVDTDNIQHGENSAFISSSPFRVAESFNLQAKIIGGVLCLAPRQKITLLPAKMPANFTFKRSPESCLPLLAARFSPDQWQQFTGTSGIGLSGMADETQAALFRSILAGLGSKVYVTHIAGERTRFSKTPKEVSDADNSLDLPLENLPTDQLQIRLRLSTAAELSVPLPVPAGTPAFFSGRYDVSSYPRKEADPPLYHLEFQAPTGTQNVTQALMPVQSVANRLSMGGMNTEDVVFNATVELTGVETVGDLVATIARATHREIYADTRYEKRTVTWKGQSSATAAALLQTLALATTGTYRKVGNAFVLTENMEGVGQRQKAWLRLTDQIKNLEARQISDARTTLYKRHPWHSLTMQGDTSVSQDQLMRFKANDNTDGSRLRTHMRITYGDLTPQQQSIAKQMVDYYKQYSANDPAAWAVPYLRPESEVSLSIAPKVSLIVPSLDQPVDSRMFIGLQSLYTVPPQPPVAHPRSAADVALAEERGKSFSHLKSRAALLAPGTVRNLTAVLPKLRRIGFTEAWLQSDPDTLLDSTSRKNLGDMLAILRKNGFESGVVVDLFRGKAEKNVDKTVLEESSSTAFAIEREIRQISQPHDDPTELAAREEDRLYLNPFSSDVQAKIRNALSTLQSAKSITKVVLRDVAPPGYDSSDMMQAMMASLSPSGDMQLGFTEENRYRFLQRFHTDPIDAQPYPSFYPNATEYWISTFNRKEVETTVRTDWFDFLKQENRKAMTALFADDWFTPKPKLLVQQISPLNLVSWYGSWDKPTDKLPELPLSYLQNLDSKILTPFFGGSQGAYLHIAGDLSDRGYRTIDFLLKNPALDQVVVDFVHGTGINGYALYNSTQQAVLLNRFVLRLTTGASK